jgi:hypothetical protein
MAIADPRHYEAVREQAAVAIADCWEDCERTYVGPGQPDPSVIFALVASRLIACARAHDLPDSEIHFKLKNELDGIGP